MLPEEKGGLRLSLCFPPSFCHHCLEDYWQGERQLSRVDCIL
jgi:hypothetical protein